MFQQSIKTNILTIFLLLVGLVAGALLTSQYYFNTKLAISSTDKTFNLVSKNISQHINKNTQDINKILLANRSNKNLQAPITFNPFHPALQSIMQMLTIKETIYAMHFTNNTGDFFEVINMKESALLYDKYKAPSDTRWAVIIIKNHTIQYSFLNKNSKLISQYTAAEHYNPLIRPWYLNALKSDSVINTNPYLFSHIKESGSTYAIELEVKGSVLAIDFTMQDLRKHFQAQNLDEEYELFIFNKDGNTFASSNLDKNNTVEDENIFVDNKSSIKFTKEELKYLANAPTLQISNEEDWAPFDFQSAGVPMGYSIDLLKVISKKSGLKINFLNGYSWSQIMNLFQTQDIDIIHSLYKTPDREKLGEFTQPIYNFKNYFITRKNQQIKSVEDLKSKKVVVIRGWTIEKFLKTNYPDIKLLIVENVANAFLAVSQGKADVFIDTQESLSYLSSQFYIDNLETSGWFKEFDEDKAKSLYMILQKDNPLLLSIINKSIKALTEKELKVLSDKWFYNKNSDTKVSMIDPALMKGYLANDVEKTISYRLDDKEYFTKYTKLNGEKLYLALKVDKKPLLKPYNENMKYSFIIAFLVLLVALPIILFSTGMIIKPIRALILENMKIKNREFNKVSSIKTHILEFRELSDSFVSMSLSIGEFQKSQAELLDSIVKLIAEAVDAKSAYTGGHCERVPEIAQLLVGEASHSNKGIFKEFKLTSKDELKEFEIGAWLHDCGKVTTPEYVVDKSTKLETINDRIHEVRTRFEVLWRDAQIDYLQAQLDGEEREVSLEILHKRQEKLQNDFAFIAKTNIGGEFMDEDKQERVKEIADQEWSRNFDDSLGLGEVEILRYDKEFAQALPATEKLLSDKKQHIIKRPAFDYEAYERDGFKEEVPENLYNYGEVYNLCIAKGTLTPEERYKINEHVILSIKMLEKIPFPSHMTKVPEYAGTHHETLVGTGYPRKLTKNELSIPARIMALSDVFEALTASDRPYKKAKTLSTSIKIMSFMVKDKHLDEDIFKLFLSSGLHKVYAERYLKKSQIDEVDISQYL